MSRNYLNVEEVVDRLSNAKNAAPEDNWWKDLIHFEFERVRSSGRTPSKWITVYYIDAKKTKHQMQWIASDEKPVGYIMPLTNDGISEMQMMFPNGKFSIRTRKPAVQIQKYKVSPQSINNDGITPVLDSEGKQKLPAPETESNHFKAIDLINEAFIKEISIRIDLGKQFVPGKMSAEEFIKEHKIQEGGIIVPSQQLAKLAGRIGNNQRYFVGCQKDNVCAMVQTSIAGNPSSPNYGRELLNPITRIVLDFDEKTKKPNFNAQDFFPDENCGDSAVINGGPVTAENVHLYIMPGCMIKKVLVNLNSICMSAMGISIPIKVDAIAVSKRQQKNDDMFNIMGINRKSKKSESSRVDAPKQESNGKNEEKHEAEEEVVADEWGM